MSYAVLSAFSILFLLVASTSLLLGIYALSVHSGSTLNRVFFSVCCFLCIWSFCFSIAIIAPSQEDCLFWRRLSAVGWGCIYASLFHFVFILTHPSATGIHKWIGFLFYLPAAVTVFVFGLSDSMARAQYRLVFTECGWTNLSVNNGWDYFFYAYYILSVCAGLLLLWNWSRHARSADEKKQAKIILTSFLCVIGFGSFTDLINSRIPIVNVPQMAPVFFIIPIFFVFYCIQKFRFLKRLSPHQDELILNDTNRWKIYKFSSFSLMLAGAVYFSMTFFPEKTHPQQTAVTGLALFLLGLVLEGIRRNKRSPRVTENVYVAATLLIIPILTIQNSSTGGLTIWAFPLVILICSLVFNKRLILVSTAISALLSQIYLWVRMPAEPVIVTNYHFAGRIVILLAAVAAAFSVNGIYTLRLKENAERAHLQTLLSEMSADFMMVEQTNLLPKLKSALDKIGSFFQADRICLCIRDEQAQFRTLLWDGAQVESLEDYPAQCWLDYIKDKNELEVLDVALLPTCVDSVRERMLSLEILSILSLSIRVRGKTRGFLTLGFHQVRHSFSEQQKNTLVIMTNILADAFIKVNAEQKIKSMAYYDHLTRLPNRQLFRDRATQLLQGTESQIGVMFLDLDSFKSINDTLGHDSGDLLLQKVAENLLHSVRPADVVSRFGGDEFLMMFPGISHPDEITEVADAIMLRFQQPFLLGGQELFVTASAGIAMFPQDGANIETLIKNADIAMYHAKGKGKNQYILCTGQIKESAQYRMQLSNDLYRALDRHELEVYYQPQIRLPDEKIIGVEALLRWHHPNCGMILPDVFIPLAEQTGQISAIGEWVLQTACRQNRDWQLLGLPEIRIAVNLSVVQLRNHALVEQVQKALDSTGLPPRLLDLEITESAAVQESNSIVAVMTRLKALGVSLSIDDFGTEYSSLSRLKSLPVDCLKMDIQFVRDINKSEKERAIAKVIISLAKNLEMKLVAEGVENQIQLDFLRQKMCDEVQGFYYYKPMPAAQIEEILRAQL